MNVEYRSNVFEYWRRGSCFANTEKAPVDFRRSRFWMAKTDQMMVEYRCLEGDMRNVGLMADRIFALQLYGGKPMPA